MHRAARQPGDIIDKINKKKTWRSKFNDFRQRVARIVFFFFLFISKLLWPRKWNVRKSCACQEKSKKIMKNRMGIEAWRKSRIQYFGDVICATARNSMEKIYMYHRRRMYHHVYERKHFQPSHVVIILYFPVRIHAASDGPPLTKYPTFTHVYTVFATHGMQWHLV